MTLKYRILWFEDDEDIIEIDVWPKVRDYLVDLGFVPEIVHRTDAKELNKLIYDGEYDLIVTDLNLDEEAEDETGKTLVDKIRSGHIYTEVLLYSASTDQIQRIIDHSGWIERISYLIGTEDLEQKLKSLIFLTVRKQQDVNNTRGLVIAETIVLEKKIENILLNYFSAAEDLVDESKKLAIYSNIHTKKVDQHNNELAKILDKNFSEIASLIEDDVLTANNCYEGILSILKDKLLDLNNQIATSGLSQAERAALMQKRDAIKALKTEMHDFRKEVLEIRNTLAHVEELKGTDGVSYLQSLKKGGESIRFDNSKYIEIRKDLQKHGKNLDGILDHLQLVTKEL